MRMMIAREAARLARGRGMEAETQEYLMLYALRLGIRPTA